jgi:hypothetical protein
MYLRDLLFRPLALSPKFSLTQLVFDVLLIGYFTARSTRVTFPEILLHRIRHGS